LIVDFKKILRADSRKVKVFHTNIKEVVIHELQELRETIKKVTNHSLQRL